MGRIPVREIGLFVSIPTRLDMVLPVLAHANKVRYKECQQDGWMAGLIESQSFRS